MWHLPWIIAASIGQAQADQPSFSGVWLIEIESDNRASATEMFTLRDGLFSRGEPGASITVKADGIFHSIESDGSVDAVAITVTNPRHLRETDTLNGKKVYSVDYEISANGGVLTRRVVDFSKPDRKPVPTKIRYSRIGYWERGISPINGKWRTIDIVTTRAHLTETIKLSGGRFSSYGTGGYGFDALVGGEAVPITGDADTARAAVTMPEERTIVVRMSLNGRATVVQTLKLLRDGRTIDVTGERLADGNVSHWKMRRE